MFYLFFLLTGLLSLSLLLSVIKSGRFKGWAKGLRIIIVVASVVAYTVLFVQKSVDEFLPNSLTVQVVNKLPFPLDFYLIKINDEADPDLRYETRHLGKIRNNHYRIDYLKMEASDEFWIAAYMGNKNLVYFSQHSVPNKNEDKIIEVQKWDKSITYDDDFTHFVIKDNNSSRKIDVFFNWINQPISVKANGNDLFTDLPLDEKEITIAPFSAKAVLSE